MTPFLGFLIFCFIAGLAAGAVINYREKHPGRAEVERRRRELSRSIEEARRRRAREEQRRRRLP